MLNSEKKISFLLLEISQLLTVFKTKKLTSFYFLVIKNLKIEIDSALIIENR